MGHGSTPATNVSTAHVSHLRVCWSLTAVSSVSYCSFTMGRLNLASNSPRAPAHSKKCLNYVVAWFDENGGKFRIKGLRLALLLEAPPPPPAVDVNGM
jgi:hypothetical protein